MLSAELLQISSFQSLLAVFRKWEKFWQGKKNPWQQAIQRHSDFAGFTDWRLPTIREVFSIVHLSSGILAKQNTDINDGLPGLVNG